ncbi:uncharacterized protein LOC129615597 [Condylostylus longicornis]|uniref:uncharacterized protein LOC129615597 n=1 Tax=Condylostylus longicornis TaxID=2530218 RepID=UPI00244DA6EC|nr:uncharacterized protein LOC129615597 [Condylostylus longicornis]
MESKYGKKQNETGETPEGNMAKPVLLNTQRISQKASSLGKPESNFRILEGSSANLEDTQELQPGPSSQVQSFDKVWPNIDCNSTTEVSKSWQSMKRMPTAVISPSRRAYRERRSAYRNLERIEKIPEDQRSEQDKSTYIWAKSIMEKRLDEKTGASKRQTTSEDSPCKAKKPRPQIPRSNAPAVKTFDQNMKNNLIIAVVDKAQDDGRISLENWRKVEKQLMINFCQVMKENPGPYPSCRDSGWHQGYIKLVTCADQRSADLYTKAIQKIGEIWPGARLAVIAKDQIPGRPRARSWVPAEPSDANTILQMIQFGNPNLPTSNWRVVKLEEKRGEYRHILIIINKESLALLEKQNFIINYGFSSITLRVYKTDAKPDGSQNRETKQNVSSDKNTGREEMKPSKGKISVESKMADNVNDEDFVNTADEAIENSNASNSSNKFPLL